METKKRRFNWQTLLIIILGISLISITVFAVNNEKKEIAKKEPEKIYVGYETQEPLENFTKKDAVFAMKDILSSIGEDVEGKERTVEERMVALDKGESDLEDIISKKTLDKLYLADEFKNDQFNRQFAASVLLTYHQLIIETTGEKEFEPVLDVFDELVYMDSKQMTAHIPLDVFLGDNKGVSFEMDYIDGEWKFNPYTAMMSLVMVVNYESQIEQMLNQKNEEK